MKYYVEISKKITKEELIKIFSKYGADAGTEITTFAKGLLEKDCKRIFSFCNDSHIILCALKNNGYTLFFSIYEDTKRIKYEIEQIKYNKDIS